MSRKVLIMAGGTGGQAEAVGLMGQDGRARHSQNRIELLLLERMLI